MTTTIVIFVSVLLAAIRISGHKGNVFKDLAHVWTGGLAGSWLTVHSNLTGWTFVALCVIEVACFLVFKSKDPEHVLDI